MLLDVKHPLPTQILMVFKREFSYYLLTIYVPSCMLVIVSWVRPFWNHNQFFYETNIYLHRSSIVREWFLSICAQVSFWLDSRSVPARVALGVTTLLTMSTQVRINHNHSHSHHPEEIFSQKVAGVSKSLPPVAYTKAIGENRLNSSFNFQL